MTYADDLREVRDTLLSMATLFDETPHGSQLRYLAAKLPDPEDYNRIDEIWTALQAATPEGYDPTSDDMTVPFAIELTDKDKRIAELAAALREIQARADAFDSGDSDWKYVRKAITKATKALGEEGT